MQFISKIVMHPFPASAAIELKDDIHRPAPECAEKCAGTRKKPTLFLYSLLSDHFAQLELIRFSAWEMD